VHKKEKQTKREKQKGELEREGFEKEGERPTDRIKKTSSLRQVVN
jgi:hypothetical protein